MPDASDIAIRPAAPSDLDALLRLCAAHAEFERCVYDADGARERLPKMLFGPAARLHCIVAERGGTPVGYATWSIEVSTWEAASYAHMDCLYLDPDARSGGIGRRLMERIAREARAAGCREMQWQTPAFNVRAMRFYERLGPVRQEKVRYTLDGAAFERLVAGGAHENTRP